MNDEFTMNGDYEYPLDSEYEDSTMEGSSPLRVPELPGFLNYQDILSFLEAMYTNSDVMVW